MSECSGSNLPHIKNLVTLVTQANVGISQFGRAAVASDNIILIHELHHRCYPTVCITSECQLMLGAQSCSIALREVNALATQTQLSIEGDYLSQGSYLLCFKGALCSFGNINITLTFKMY